MGMLERFKDTQDVIHSQVDGNFPGLVQIAQGSRPQTYSITMYGRTTVEPSMYKFFFLAGVKDGNDIRVVQAGNGLCLAPETGLHHGVSCHFRAQELDGYLAAQNLVESQVDIRHSSSANELADDESAIEYAFAGHRVFPFVIYWSAGGSGVLSAGQVALGSPFAIGDVGRRRLVP